MNRGDRYKQEANAQLKRAVKCLKGAESVLGKNQIKDKQKQFEVTKMISMCTLLRNLLDDEVLKNRYRDAMDEESFQAVNGVKK